MVTIPSDLIRLERIAEIERAKLAGLKDEEFEAQRCVWSSADQAFHAAVAEFAARTGAGLSREAVEREVRNAARRGDEDPAVE
ncbi:hypothetical protein V1460_18945 [Streptomyces sp. SCSIO 30461]|uniref:hypothetical protein n=1 Tax=Streptomyces sp. SCSIO 30461 TaxID=3118085 RepID=UPI0030CDDF2D